MLLYMIPLNDGPLIPIFALHQPMDRQHPLYFVSSYGLLMHLKLIKKIKCREMKLILFSLRTSAVIILKYFAIL